MKTLWRLSLMFIILLICTLVFTPSEVLAHGGEQHAAPDIAAVPLPGSHLISLSAMTENFELVVKYPPMRPNQKETFLVYLSDYTTNKPINGAEINVTLPETLEESIKVESTQTSGMYRFDLVLPTVGKYEFLFDIMAETSDLIPLSGLQVVNLPSWKKFHFPFGVLKYVMGFLILIVMIWKFRKKIRPFGIKSKNVSLFFFLITVFLIPSRGLTHGGESHGNTEFASDPKTATQERIPLSKESQFLLGVRTVLVEKKELLKTVRALGKVIPRPQTSAEIFSIQEGIILPPSSKNFPMPGKRVKRGETLAMIQSIGTFSVRAPISGTITEVLFTRGQHVEHDTKLISIIDFSKLWVEANIYEVNLPKIKKTKKAFITSKIYPEKPFDGKLVNLGQVIDANTRTTKAIFEVENPEEILRVGMIVEVALKTGEIINQLVVPEKSIIEKGDTNYVYVHTHPEEFESRRVTLGEKVQSYWEILSGLKEGERVVTDGNYQLSTTVVPKTD